MKEILLFIASFFMYMTLSAQAVGIGTTTPHVSSILELKSTSRGFLMPRMTTAQRNSIPAAEGLMVFDTDLKTMFQFDGSTWKPIGGSSGSGTSLWTESPNNTNWIYTADSVGIGTASPAERLHINNGSIRISRSVLGSVQNNLEFNMGNSTTAIRSEGINFLVDNERKGYIRYSVGGLIGVQGLAFSGTGAANNMIITPEGNVGIATSSPSSPLEVNGKITATSLTSGSVNATNATVQEVFASLKTSIFNSGLLSNGDITLQSGGLLNLRADALNIGFVQLSGNNIRIGTYGDNTTGKFVVRTGGGDRLFVDAAGNVSIGSASAANGYKLSVAGKVMAEELRIRLQASWPDYVFSDQYQLRNLSELENYIRTHHRLPNIPAAFEVEKNGMDMGEMQRRMMEKIEELTLYIIQQQKEIDELRSLIKNRQ